MYSLIYSLAEDLTSIFWFFLDMICWNVPGGAGACLIWHKRAKGTFIWCLMALHLGSRYEDSRRAGGARKPIRYENWGREVETQKTCAKFRFFKRFLSKHRCIDEIFVYLYTFICKIISMYVYIYNIYKVRPTLHRTVLFCSYNNSRVAGGSKARSALPCISLIGCSNSQVSCMVNLDMS